MNLAMNGLEPETSIRIVQRVIRRQRAVEVHELALEHLVVRERPIAAGKEITH